MKTVKPKNKQNKPKICAQCKKTFTPTKHLQNLCGPRCEIDRKRASAARKAECVNKTKRKARKAVKPLAYYSDKARDEFNAYIRERDALDPCISCGQFDNRQFHAGHYRTVGSNPELRFNEDNCHKQCSSCNNFKSANLKDYTPNLIAKIGQVRFEILMGPHPALHYKRFDFENIRDIYKAKRKALKLERAA